MRISDWSSDVCSSDLHMHRRDMRVRHMRDEADAGREEARILARAVDRLREIGRELAADGRDVDADLFEHLPGHHAAYPAAPFAGLHSIGLAVPGRIGERGVAARLSLDRLKFGAEDRKSTRLNSSHKCATRMPS